MRKYRLPFRAGHHFASEMVDDARAGNIRPSDFPYAEARRIYGDALRDMGLPAGELPLSEAEFRAALDPAAIVRDRATSGGPQPAEMDRMLGEADREVAAQGDWIRAQRGLIDASLASLDTDFGDLLGTAHAEHPPQ